MKINHKMLLVAALAFVIASFETSAQKYQGGLVDKTIAVVGNEMIMLSQLEEDVQTMRAYGMLSDKTGRCDILEQMMTSKLFLMQARVDSINVNNDMVEGELRNRIDNIRTQLGGDAEVEKYFGISASQKQFNRISIAHFSYTDLVFVRDILKNQH